MAMVGQPLPVDPFLRHWMLFVDGENLTIEGKKLIDRGPQEISLQEGKYYMPDVFAWFPDRSPIGGGYPHSRRIGTRAYYYTSTQHGLLAEARRRLRQLDFTPAVFEKPDKRKKSKGVDIALTKDMLSHAFLGNYQLAILMAGDGDYVPLVEELKRLGKVVHVEFFKDSTNENLVLAADSFSDITNHFVQGWRNECIRLAALRSG